jgi:hypothetical protein
MLMIYLYACLFAVFATAIFVRPIGFTIPYSRVKLQQFQRNGGSMVQLIFAHPDVILSKWKIHFLTFLSALNLGPKRQRMSCCESHPKLRKKKLASTLSAKQNVKQLMPVCKMLRMVALPVTLKWKFCLRNAAIKTSIYNQRQTRPR